MATVSLNAERRLVFPTQWIVRVASWPLSFFVVVLHVTFGDPGFSSEALTIAGVFGAAAFVSIAYAQPRVLPLLQVLLVRFYFALGFPVFSPPRFETAAAGRIRISSRSLDETMYASLLFLFVAIVVFQVVRPVGRLAAAKMSRLLDRPDKYSVRDTVTARCLAAASVAIYWLIAMSPGKQNIFGGLAYPATLFASPVLPLGLLFWDAERTQTFNGKLIFWLCALGLSLAGFSTGMLGSAVEPFVHAILFTWTVRGRLPIILLVVTTTGLIALNHAKIAYRGLTWHQKRDITLVERADSWLTAIDGAYRDDVAASFEHSANSTASRLSTLMQVAHMFEWVPGRVPYAGPDAWVNVPLGYIPRVLWPSKPSQTELFNNLYTTTFRVQTRRMTGTTTLTLPSIGDGYWRLGWLGVALEGVVLGILAGFYQGLAEPASRGLCILVTGFVLSCAPESHVLGLVAMQPQYLTIMFLVLWMAQGLPDLIGGAVKTRLVFRRRSIKLGRVTRT